MKHFLKNKKVIANNKIIIVGFTTIKKVSKEKYKMPKEVIAVIKIRITAMINISFFIA
ncbi:hypothetical protein BN1088_1431736 [Sphingobacterium sp. PM2-P1-29]|nr:hypothetical protein BN1088_1431736 [Sphingobacterium sp. PM2-P1-29]